MKLEIHIPELAELNTNVRQLIDTLNDLAVVGINAVKCEDKPAAASNVAEAIAAQLFAPQPYATEVEPEKPKRPRKTKAEEPAPEPAVAEAEPQVEPAPTVAEPEPEQPASVAIEPQSEPEATTYVLADCTALSPKLQTAGKLDEAKAWLKEHGADRLKDLDPSHYGSFIAFAKGLLG